MSLVWHHSFPCKKIVISRWVGLTRWPSRTDPTRRPNRANSIRRPKWVRPTEKPIRTRPPADPDMPDRPNGPYRTVVLVKFVNLVWPGLSRSLARLGPIKSTSLPSPYASLDQFVSSSRPVHFVSLSRHDPTRSLDRLDPTRSLGWSCYSVVG